MSASSMSTSSTIAGQRQPRFSGAKSATPRKRVGLLAGWGRYPIVVAEALKEQGYEVCCLGVRNHADPRLAESCDHFDWLGLGRLGKAIRWFQRHEVNDVTMAGKIHKVVLFQPWLWVRHLPDWRTIRVFWPHFVSARKDKKDDTLLTTIIDEFAGQGIRFAPATNYAPQLLVRGGQLTRRGPTPIQLKDIEFGWKLAKEMGRLDVGQSVAVKGQAVLAVEAIEGTDECIRRAGTLCKSREFTVVKVAKPQQDMRFDVPTIGLGTLKTMVEAGGRVLAIEAGKTIVLDEAEVIQFADRHQLVIVSVNSEAQKDTLN